MNLPKKIYVYVENDGEEDFLMTQKNIEDCADAGNNRLVGVYDLAEKLNVTLVVKQEVIVDKA